MSSRNVDRSIHLEQMARIQVVLLWPEVGPFRLILRVPVARFVCYSLHPNDLDLEVGREIAQAIWDGAETM